MRRRMSFKQSYMTIIASRVDRKAILLVTTTLGFTVFLLLEHHILHREVFFLRRAPGP